MQIDQPILPHNNEIDLKFSDKSNGKNKIRLSEYVKRYVQIHIFI